MSRIEGIRLVSRGWFALATDSVESLKEVRQMVNDRPGKRAISLGKGDKMNKLLSVLVVLALVVGSSTAGRTPGLQVVDCVEDPPGSGVWIYSFFVCTGAFNANDLHIGLTPAEII